MSDRSDGDGNNGGGVGDFDTGGPPYRILKIKDASSVLLGYLGVDQTGCVIVDYADALEFDDTPSNGPWSLRRGGWLNFGGPMADSMELTAIESAAALWCIFEGNLYGRHENLMGCMSWNSVPGFDYPPLFVGSESGRRQFLQAEWELKT